MKNLVLGALVSLLVACSSGQKDGGPGSTASPSPTGSSTSATSPTPVAAKDSGSLVGALEMMCKHDKDERVLTIVPKGAGCKLHYQKFGSSEVKASSVSGQQYCENVRSRMKGNLEAAGFNCQ